MAPYDTHPGRGNADQIGDESLDGFVRLPVCGRCLRLDLESPSVLPRHEIHGRAGLNEDAEERPIAVWAGGQVRLHLSS